MIFPKLKKLFNNKKTSGLEKTLDDILFTIRTSKTNDSLENIISMIGTKLNQIGINFIFYAFDNTKKYFSIKQAYSLHNIKIPDYGPLPIEKIITPINGKTTSAVFIPKSLLAIMKAYPPTADFFSTIPNYLNFNSIIAPLILRGEAIGFVDFLSARTTQNDVDCINNFSKELTIEITQTVLFHEIKKSEERYRDLFENANDGFYIFNGRKKRYVEVNIGFCELSGYTKDELLQMNYLLVFAPEERIKINTYVKNRLDGFHGSTEAPREYETKILTKQGETKFILIKITRIINTDEWFCIIHDKTEKKLAEKILKENEEMYRKLVENAGSIILRRQLDGTITFINEYAEKFFGFTKKEIIGKNVIGTIVPPTDSNGKNLVEMIKNISRAPQDYSNNQNENVKKDGTRAWIAWTNKGIYDENKKLSEILAVGIDITQEKLNQKIIRELNEFNQRILDNAPVSIIVLDKDGQIIVSNSLAQKWMNKTSEESIGRSIFETNTMKKNQELCRRYKKLLSSGEPVHLDNILYRPEKEEEKIIYLNFIAVPLFNPEGKIDGAISMALDNTDIIQAKLKLENLNKELEEKVESRTQELSKINQELRDAMEAKVKFIADASHEMRTPLTIIQGNLHLIKQEIKNPQPETEENIDLIKKEIKHMTSILSDLTMLAMADTAGEKLSCSRVDLALLISAVSRSLKILADEKNINIKYSWPNQPLEIIGDEDKLEKVFYNLIRNAIRYNKNNGWIKIEALPDETGINVYIEDGGIGIPEKDLTNIFERFYRVDTSRSRKDGGSGLGLAICKSIVEAHQGIVFAESILNTGSVFKVWLPYDCKNINNT